MPRYLLCILALTSCLSSASNAEPLKDLAHPYALMLLGSDYKQYKAAAKSIYGDKMKHPVLFDFLAERLSQSYGERGFDADSHAWFIRALGMSGSDRYRKIVDASVENLEGVPKIRRHYRRAIKNMTEVATPYVPGELDIDAIQREVEANIAASKQPSFEAIQQFNRCAPAEEVFRQIGYPDQTLLDITTSQHIPYRGRIEFTQLVVHYEGFAKIMMERGDQVSWCYLRTLPDLQSAKSPNDLVDESLRRKLWSWDKDSLKEVGKSVVKKKRYDEALLDEIVLRLWWGRDDTDPMTTDGLKHLVRAVQKSKNPRYIDAMKIIRKEAKSNKTYNAIESYLKRTKNTGVEQFVPSPETTASFL